MMRNLRDQVESLERDLRKSEDERQRLEAAVRRRETELSQVIQKSSSLALQAGSTADSRLDMLAMADSANARIIDQLNGQVDFLNDQLAQREAQLAQVGEQLLAAQEIKIECENR